MSQWPRLFSTCRIPRLIRDDIHHFQGSRHIIVLRNGHAFAFDVVSRDGKVEPVDAIAATLFDIQRKFKTYLPSTFDDSLSHSIPTLTAADRDTWATLRQDLSRHPTNAESLALIDSALFVVCLDSEEDVKSIHNTHAPSIARALHNRGRNRWFDK
jgi:carnitine O-palmitoyltransferase 2